MTLGPRSLFPGPWLRNLGGRSCLPETGGRLQIRPFYRQGDKAKREAGASGRGRRPRQPLPDGLDPLVTLLCTGGRDSIRLVLALHHLALAVRLTRLDLLAPAAGVVELQAELRGGGWVRARQGWEETAVGPGFLGRSARTSHLGLGQTAGYTPPGAGFPCQARGAELLLLTLRTYYVPGST